MEFPDPWHESQPKDWPRRERALARLNWLRAKNGIPIFLGSERPIHVFRLDGPGSETPYRYEPPITGGSTAEDTDHV